MACLCTGADAGHLHEGGAVAAGEEAAGHGEAAQGEDDPLRHASQGIYINQIFHLIKVYSV